MSSETNRKRPAKAADAGSTPEATIPVKALGADAPEPKEAQLMRHLGRVNARLQAIQGSGTFENASTDEAGQELTQLRDAIDVDRDIEAAQVGGLMYFFRSLAMTDPDQTGSCFVESLLLLRPVFKSGKGLIPEPVAAVFQKNPRWLGDYWKNAMLADAERLATPGVDDPFTLSIAIALTRKCMELIPDNPQNPSAPGADGEQLRLDTLSNLGLFLRLRCEVTGSEADVEEALHIALTCLRRQDETSAGRARLEFNTSLAHRDRYRLKHFIDDLKGWLTHAQGAVKNAASGDPSRGTMIENLITAQQHLGEESDEFLDEILSATHADPTGGRKATLPEISEAINRAAALISRYERRGRPEDIDEAVTVLRYLLDQPLLPASERAGCLSNLSIALMRLYDLRGVALDIEEGLAAARKAVDSAQADDPERAMYNSNLSLLTLTYVQHQGLKGAYLDQAVDSARAALAATPTSDQRYAAFASNLATALLARAQRTTPNRADLDEAVELIAAAMAHEGGRQNSGRFQANSAYAHLRRYRVTNSALDLEVGIAQSQLALKSLSADEPGRGDTLVRLVEALMARHQPGDLEACMIAAQEATHLLTAALTKRLQAAYQWAEAASKLDDWPLACQAFATASDLLHLMTSRPFARPDQEFAASRAAGLPSRAAAAHLLAGDPNGAAEAFERNHAILLAHELGTRRELRELAKTQPKLWEQYRKLRERLAFLDERNLDVLRVDETGREPYTRPETLALERSQLFNDLNDIIAKIRALNGFSHFGSGPSTQDLHQAAKECPVVLLSVSSGRSDALIITPTQVEVVPLPQATPESVEQKAVLLWGAIDDIQQNFTAVGTPLFAEYAIQQVLAWLWDCVTEPVLNALGFSGPPDAKDPWPTVCWCPSGFLSLLPLHAAGHHETRSAANPRTVMDRVISTYTATVGTLLEPMSRDKASPCDLVVVAMPSTPGAQDLPGAALEAQSLGSLFGNRARLLGDVNGGSPATVSAVLATLPLCRWAHFACHAFSDIIRPSSSRLVFADGTEHPLTFRELTSLDLDDTKMAFLSACATGRPAPALLDEVVSLASAFTLVGYTHVVATLWPVGDRSAAFIAESFYRQIQRQNNASDTAALALHSAIRQLRDQAPGRPSKWAAHIHVGRAGSCPS